MKEENNEIVSAAETISVDYEEILQRAVALLPWLHNILILSKDLNDSATLYYAQECDTLKQAILRQVFE